jgi:hypothetical protein
LERSDIDLKTFRARPNTRRARRDERPTFDAG